MSDGIAVPIIDRNYEQIAQSFVEDADAERVFAHKWSLHPRGYGQANIDGKRVLMHRFVLELPSVGKGRGSGVFVAQVDHINGDKLDNRRSNLRIVTNQQNHQNRQTSHGSSRFRGVYWNKHAGKWMARIKVNQKAHYLGLFADEHDAAVAAYEARQIHFAYSVEDPPKRVRVL